MISSTHDPYQLINYDQHPYNTGHLLIKDAYTSAFGDFIVDNDRRTNQSLYPLCMRTG